MGTPDPKLIGIRLTANPRSDVWQVPTATPEFSVYLIGWITNGIPVEAGVPPEAMQVLSEALTRLAVVTFLSDPHTSARLAPNQWHDAASGWVAVLTETNSVGARRHTLPLIATADAGVAQELFRSSSFDWNQQAQMALLSEPGHPPAIDYGLVQQCLRRSSIVRVIRDLHLFGILYPAVDGDFAALVSSDSGFAEYFQRELRRACQATQLPFAAISEEEFRRTQWMEQPG
jgi:hypothetical protein